MAKGASINEVRKKVTKTYELITTSYHEAGHTIFALLHYMKVNSVYIFEHKIFKRIHGFTQYESNLLEDDTNLSVLLEQEIGLSYAGLLAEKHHFKSISGSDQVPMFIKEGSSDDLLAIRQIIQKYNPVHAGKERVAYKKKIIRKSLALLIQYWEAVDLVSHNLFKHKRLSYQDLKTLLTTKSRDKKFWKETFREIDRIFPS
jgi:hypothetical protein